MRKIGQNFHSDEFSPHNKTPNSSDVVEQLIYIAYLYIGERIQFILHSRLRTFQITLRLYNAVSFREPTVATTNCQNSRQWDFIYDINMTKYHCSKSEFMLDLEIYDLLKVVETRE